MRRAVLIVIIVGFAMIAGGAVLGDSPTNPADDARYFETNVRPLLADRCFKCHGPEKQESKLRLDSRAAILAGGESGPAIMPGKPEASLLVEAIHYDGLEMPPDGRLSPREIEALEQWIKLGAPWPGAEADSAAPLVPRKDFQITDEDKAFWSFQPPRRPPVPEVVRDGMAEPPVNALDAFIRHKLRGHGLSPSSPADCRELLRRLHFDLLGLPPSPREMRAFVEDDSPDAFERQVDRLLASPHYGERWGRHWLDVVRFAQTNGYERDDEKPFAWRYRDYVIQAWNEDKPFDQFIREQLAGDELDQVTDDSLAATAFYRVGVWDDEPDDSRQAEFDELDDMLSTTGTAFLGLTIGCARCHDHKFDPISQRDYYGLTAFLRDIKGYVKHDAKEADDTIFAPLAGGEKTLAVRAVPPSGLKPTHLLVRGDAGSPGQEVAPQFPEVLRRDDAQELQLPGSSPSGQTSGRRRLLAEWIANSENPLTARVLANRLWRHHFGQGLVPTPSDFGRTGQPPSHPELLDWLAAELVDSGWSIKHVQRLIVTSATWRQSSRVNDQAASAADPDNRLLWRQSLRRLEAEAIRDSVLAVSGQLNHAMNGRGVFPKLPPEVLATQSRPGLGWDNSSQADRSRRSVYVFVKRTLLVPLLETLDAPSPDQPEPSRKTTTIAPQALILLNGEFLNEQAEFFAQRVQRESGDDDEGQIHKAFESALQREPTSEELSIARDYLARQNQRSSPDAAQSPLAGLCLLLLNLNEFVYAD